jgi:hypothetical protein
MAKKKVEDAVKLETGVETCARLGFVVGDILASKFWDDACLKIVRIEADHLWVERVTREGDGWRVRLDHKMMYLPSDVRKWNEGVIETSFTQLEQRVAAEVEDDPRF